MLHRIYSRAALMAGLVALAGCKSASTSLEPTVVCRITGVSLTSVQAEMVVGQSVDVQAALTQTGCSDLPPITLSSSNPAVVTVSGKTVTAVGAGQATLTASIQGRAETATAQVTVAGRVLSLTVTPETGSVLVASTLQITANLSVDPGASAGLTWSTSDPAKATVSSTGLVTGVGAGVVTITARADLDTTKKASAQVTVVPRVSGVTVTPGRDTLKVTQTRQLSATVSGDPGIATGTTWRSSDPSVATVSGSGLVTAVAQGTSTITVLSAADTTKQATAVIVVLARVTGISINPPGATINVGATAGFSATVQGDAGIGTGVTWSSSNPAIATVGSTGTVTAVAPGSTSITATSVADPTQSATAGVTVTAPVPTSQVCAEWDYPPVAGVRAAAAPRQVRNAAARLVGGCPTTIDMELIPHDAVKIYALHYPDYADLFSNLTTSNSAVAAVVPDIDGFGGIVVPVGVGTATITLQVGAQSIAIRLTVKASPVTAVCASLTPTGPCITTTQTIRVGQSLDLYGVSSGVNVPVFWDGNFSLFDWIPAIGRKTTIIGIALGSDQVLLNWGIQSGASNTVNVQIVP